MTLTWLQNDREWRYQYQERGIIREFILAGNLTRERARVAAEARIAYPDPADIDKRLAYMEEHEDGVQRNI